VSPGRALLDRAQEQEHRGMMSMDQTSVTRLVIDTLAANPKVNQPISGGTVIVDDLGLDSLAVMDFVMEIEDKLDVSVPLDRLTDIRTVDDLARCLTELTSAR
jgi:acyl carrier protein